MRIKSLAILPAVALFSTGAAASTTSGYVTSVTLANSSYTNDYACTVQISSSSTSSTGTTFYVDDVTNRHDASCSLAMLAMYFDDALTVAYTTTGGINYLNGFTNGRSTSDVTTFRTGSYTGSSYPHHCQAAVTTSSGSSWLNVDDDNPEEHVACATLAMLHFATGSAASYTATTDSTTSELNQIQVVW